MIRRDTTASAARSLHRGNQRCSFSFPVSVPPILAQSMCGFPEQVHPASQLILDYYVNGVIDTPSFLRFFSLPNSDYIPLARCFVNMVLGSLPIV